MYGLLRYIYTKREKETRQESEGMKAYIVVVIVVMGLVTRVCRFIPGHGIVERRTKNKLSNAKSPRQHRHKSAQQG
jgi:hypothetical protein